RTGIALRRLGPTVPPAAARWSVHCDVRASLRSGSGTSMRPARERRSTIPRSRAPAAARSGHAAPKSPPAPAKAPWATSRLPPDRQVDAVASRLLAGERAARPSPPFDASAYRCALGAAIPDAPAAGRHRRFLDRLGLHALEVGVEALAATGLRPGDPRLDRAG